MSEAQIALDAAIEAQRQGSAALQTARAQLQALVTSRGEAETELLTAKAALKAATAALAKGGGEKVFHDAMNQVVASEARCRAFNEDVIPEAETAVADAEEAMPCARRLAVLQFRVRAQTDLLPLYEQHAASLANQAEILERIEEAHSVLRQEFRGAYPTLFGQQPESALGDLLKSVPPTVRAFSRHLFTDIAGDQSFESRFLQHDPEALAKLHRRLGEEPSEAEIAKFNGPIYQAYTPPLASEPPPAPGPAKMRGVVLGPGAAGAIR